MFAILLLAAACKAGSAVAGLDPEDPVLNPIIVSIDLRTARASYATDEGALIESKGRLSTGQTVDADTEWLALDGGTVTAVSDGSKALFGSTSTGTFRVVGKGKGWGKGGSGGGGGSTSTDTTAVPVDTVTIIVAPAPAPLASISVTPATDTVYRGWTQLFTVTGTRTDGSSATPMVNWTTSGGTVDAGGYYLAPQTDGSYRVVAKTTDGTLADTSAVAVTQAPSHEPQGYVRFAEQRLSGFPGSSATTDIAGRWWTASTSNLSVVSASDAPASASATLRTKFPAGFGGGSAPTNWGGWDGAKGERRAVYFSAWVRLNGVDYENHAVGTKAGFFAYGLKGSGAENQGFLMIRGDGTQSIASTWRIAFYQQGHVSRNLNQNVNTGRVIRAGAWQHWELVMELNTIGSANGVLKMWVDGAPVLDYRDVVYATADNPAGFYAYKWNPTWGGMGGTRTREDAIDFDHIYISGVPK